MHKTPNISVGPTTIAGGTITLASFAVAVLAFINGARDAETFSALSTGLLALLVTLGGRYGQAIAQAFSYGTGLPRTATVTAEGTSNAPAGNAVSSFSITSTSPSGAKGAPSDSELEVPAGSIPTSGDEPSR